MVICFALRCSLFKVLIAVTLLQFIFIVDTQAEGVAYYLCPNSTTYTQDSTYDGNLKSYFSYLNSDNAINSLFNNTRIGGNGSDATYGQFLCRGDLTVEACRQCVQNAPTTMQEKCPTNKEAYVWYDDKCMLRYNNISFFGIMATDPFLFMRSPSTVSNPKDLDGVVKEVLDELITRASGTGNVGPVKFFATTTVNFTSNLSNKLYHLAQCTPDLSSSDCGRCLNIARGRLVLGGYQGARVLAPSCTIRYESDPFYNITDSTSVSLPPPEGTQAKHVAYSSCLNTTTYTQNSTYAVNLKSYFSALSSESVINSLFNNTRIGDNGPDATYGQFLCRGDLTVEACRECVQNAPTAIQEKCPTRKEAYVWYDDKCMLRYNNISFFGIMATEPNKFMKSLSTVSNPNDLDGVVKGVLNELITRASGTGNVGPVKFFATTTVNFTSNLSNKLYHLAQCTPDLSSSDCGRCLNIARDNLELGGYQGARVLSPSCTIRYESDPFYSDIADSTAQPNSTIPRSLPPPAENDGGQRPRKDAWTGIIIIFTFLGLG